MVREGCVGMRQRRRGRFHLEHVYQSVVRRCSPKISAPDGFCRGEGGTPPGAGATTLMAASAEPTGLWQGGSGKKRRSKIFCLHNAARRAKMALPRGGSRGTAKIYAGCASRHTRNAED